MRINQIKHILILFHGIPKKIIDFKYFFIKPHFLFFYNILRLLLFTEIFNDFCIYL